MSNQTGFRQGRLGIGRNPIFPLDISGSTRIEGDLILGGTIADITGTPIKFGGVTSTLNVGTNMPIPEMTITEVPSWEDSVTVEGAGKFLDGASSGDIYYNGGNVGIGTTTPIGKLQVATTSGNLDVVFSAPAESDCRLVLQRNHGTNAGGSYNTIGDTFYIDWLIDNNSDNSSIGLKFTSKFREYIPPPSTGPYPLKTNDVMFLHYEGNVGIGTTDPLTKLHISDSGNSTLKIVSTNATSPGIELIRTIVNHSSHHDSSVFADDAWTDWKIYNNNSKLEFQGGYRTASSGNHLSTSPQTLVTAMTLMNTGNVGIGTTSPKAKLHVKGGHLLVTEGEKSKDETGGCIQFHSVENGYDTAMWGQDYAHSLIADVKYDSGGYDDKTEMLFFKGNNKDGDWGPDRFHFVGAADFRITLGSPGDATGKHGHEAARQHSSWANGEEATFIVKANGKVGIGTNSPSDFLTVRHPSSGSTWRGIGLEENDGTVRWRLALAGTNGSGHCYQYMVNESGTQTVQIHADSTTYFNGGNVAIGTTTSAGKLEIANASSVTSYQDHANTSIIMRNPTSTADFNSSITWTDHTPNSWGHQSMLGITGNCGASHGLSLWGFNGRRISLCSIDNNTDSTPWDSPSLTVWQHKVGIGTTSPGEKLQVNGCIKIKQQGQIQHNSTQAYEGLVFENTGSLHSWYMGYRHGGYFTIGHYNAASYYEYVTILADGNIGIGTSSPDDKLDVEGDVRVIGGLKFQPGESAYDYASFSPIYWGDQPNHYYIQPIKYNEATMHQTKNYTKLRIMWHTGIWLGAHRNYGGVSFWDDATESDGTALDATKVASIGDGTKCSLWLGNVYDSRNYQGLYCWGGHHIDIYNSSSRKTPQDVNHGTNMYLNHYAHKNRTGVFTACGGPLSCGYNGGDNGATGHMRKVLHIGATYNKTGFSWGWWIGGQNEGWSSSDGDLYFGVCRGSTTANHAGYLQDSSGDTRMNFTGQHRTFVKQISHKETEPYIGLIVSANQNKYIKMGDKKNGGVETGNKAITISEALPLVALTTKEKDKSCFGVISDVEDEERREFGGNFKSLFQKEKGDTRTFINSLGEGGIWVTNKNGNLESGDYITSSIIPGYGQKQDSEFLANYTVAKITMDCDFNPQQQKVKKIKKHDIKVTYYKSVIPKEDANREWHDKPTPHHDYKEDDDEWVSIMSEEDYNNLKDEEWDGDWENPTKSCYVAFEKDELENDMDENNEFMWEDTDEYEYAYNLRYLLEDGTQITKQEYETKKANNETVYIAAFVGCTYHCG